MSCTECAGVYGESSADRDVLPVERMGDGYLGGLSLPPAGVKGRTPEGVLKAAETWGALQRLGMARGICPRCSAPMDQFIRVCEDHDASEGLCGECDYRHAVQIDNSCPNCPYAGEGMAVVGLEANTDLLAFLTSHGLNPLAPTPDAYRVAVGYDEEILSTDPFEARFTWTVDGDTLALTVDDDLNVVEVEEGQAADTGR